MGVLKDMTNYLTVNTAFSLSMFCCFCSIEGCTYRFRVVLILECPKISLNVFISNPSSTQRVAKVCRYGIITTNGKSLYFQGVHAFAVIYSIPFPS